MVTLLDGWCTLNSSFGGPLLALVTIGGFIAIGKTLIYFPQPATGGVVADRNRKNRFRAYVLSLGLVTAVLLLLDIAAYLWAFANVRKVEKACVDALTDAGTFSLQVFFLMAAATAVFGSVYAFLLHRVDTG